MTERGSTFLGKSEWEMSVGSTMRMWVETVEGRENGWNVEGGSWVVDEACVKCGAPLLFVQWKAALGHKYLDDKVRA